MNRTTGTGLVAKPAHGRSVNLPQRRAKQIVSASAASTSKPAPVSTAIRRFVSRKGQNKDAVEAASRTWGKAMRTDTNTLRLLGLTRTDEKLASWLPKLEHFWSSLLGPFARSMKGNCLWVLEGQGAGKREDPYAICLACRYPQEYPSEWEQLVAGLYWALLVNTPTLQSLSGFLTGFEQFDVVKKQVYKDHGDLLYICMFATSPDHQRKGYGARLMQDVLDYADSLDLPVYLEASNEASAAFYAAQGFEQTRVLTLQHAMQAKGFPPGEAYCMLRPRRSSRAAPQQ